MRKTEERNLDAELAAAFEEDEQLFKGYYKANDPGEKDYWGKEKLSAADWTKRLYGNREEEKPVNTNFGNMIIPEDKPEENVFQKITAWAADNPCKAILGALLIGGGAYLLGKHLRKRSSDNASLKRRRRMTKVQKAENNVPQEEQGSGVTGKEIAIGVAAAAGGALVGTVLNDYAIASSVPLGVIGVAKNNIPLIAAAIGLALSGALKEAFQSFSWAGSKEKEKEMKENGFLKTMLGYLKPGVASLRGA